MNVTAFVDDNKFGTELLGIPIISTQECMNEHSEANFSIAMGENFILENISKKYKSELPKAKFIF